MGVTPIARFCETGESREALSAPTEQDNRALQAAADAAKRVGHRAAVNPDDVARTVVTAYLLERAAQAFKDPEVLRALTSRRPWDMVKLIDKSKEEEAVILAALPIVGDLVAEMDPSGTKPLFAYSRDEIIRLFEAVIWVWEDGRKGQKAAPPPPAAPAKRAAKADNSAPFYDDPIPF